MSGGVIYNDLSYKWRQLRYSFSGGKILPAFHVPKNDSNLTSENSTVYVSILY